MSKEELKKLTWADVFREYFEIPENRKVLTDGLEEWSAMQKCTHGEVINGKPTPAHIYCEKCSVKKEEE